MKPEKLFPALFFCLIFAIACSQTVTPAAAPQNTQTPINNSAAANPPVALITQPQPTSTPELQSTDTPQLQATLAPQSQSSCTDSASFVTDVTVPDNTNFNQGVTFLKTWRILNTGTCTWNENYSMVFVNGDQMNSIASIPFKSTAPGATLDLSVNLVAPSIDGAYTGNYELHNAAGQLILIDNTRTVWVKISVGSGAAQKAVAAGGTATPTSTPANATSVATNTPAPGKAGACTFFEDFSVENDLVNQVNAARAAYDLPPLKRNAKLSPAALSHSIDMACHSSISHDGSDGSTITGRIAAHGYSYSYWNEAIYAQPPEYGGNAAAAVDWWLNDPPHRKIILSEDAKDIGPGYVYVAGSKLGGYFTIDVASPAP